MKFFNTAGPVNRPNHYKLDPLTRFNLEEIMELIKAEKYFILHAPRQTGKTSSMLALRDYLNNSGDYNAIYMNVEVGQAARNNIESGIAAIVSEFANRVENRKIYDEFSKIDPNDALNSALKYLCENSEKPVVLFIDEIDALVGDTLISVLRQIRAGYDKRPAQFPVSIILCGVRNIQDYRIHRTGEDIITGGSAFNIKAKSLKLGNFSQEEVKTLLLEHTKVFDYIFDMTDGQPWLVNAVAYELTYEMKENRDRAVLLTKKMAEIAVNRVTVSRATHLDQLADKLKEDRVRRVILPMILNEMAQTDPDDKEYCIDLGLVKMTPEGLKIANKIYQEIVPRELTDSRQDDFLVRFRPEWISEGNNLNTAKLFEMFTDFWRENSEIWASNIAGYEEAAPHLVFQAFLQRVANGSGFVYREYGLGRRRTDLLLKWKNGKNEEFRVVVELKVLKEKDNLEKVKKLAIEQTAEYAKRVKSNENHIVIFDRDEKTDWREKLFTEVAEFDGMKFNIWGV